MNVTKQTKGVFKVEKKDQKWHLIDAKGRVLGRLAVKIAGLLMGKGNASFARNVVGGGKVVVINAALVDVTGSKRLNKLYIRHTGYPGGIKEETFEQKISKQPEKVIIEAVNGMLPKNKLRKHWLNNLYVYKGAEHPHQGQVS